MEHKPRLCPKNRRTAYRHNQKRAASTPSRRAQRALLKRALTLCLRLLATPSPHSLALAAAASVGCERAVPSDRAVAWCERLGICREGSRSEQIDVYFDPAPDSTATKANLSVVLSQVLERAEKHPASIVRLFGRTQAGSGPMPLGEAVSPARLGFRSAQNTAQSAWTNSTREMLMTKASPAFQAPPMEPYSLAWAIRSVALRDDGSKRPRHLVIVADGLDPEAFGTALCGAVFLTDERLTEQAPGREILTPRLLDGMRVHLAFFEPRRAGCAGTSDARYSVAAAIWGSLLWRAGAVETLIERSGGVHFTDDPLWASCSAGFRLIPALP
jgi:hypothetical protein